MIHIATVHHHRADWIELQRDYLERFIEEPFRMYGSLEGIAGEFHRFFDVVVPSKGPHSGKLNLLGRIIVGEADPDDLIIFLDGDAFPVSDPIRPVRDLLERSSLAAVCRTENNGDRQPHPCFCAVPVSVWAGLPGDWSPGYCFDRNRTDVGANLLFLLESTGTEWSPILRSNRRDLHPVLFGIYGGFLYHHGAGFQGVKTTRADAGRKPVERGDDATKSELRWRALTQAPGMTQEKVDRIIERAMRNTALSEEVFAQIQADPEFYRRFI